MKRIMLFINSRGESTSSTKKNFKELTNNDRDDELKKNYHDEDIEDDDQDSEDEDDEDDGDDEAEEEEEEDNNEEFEKSNNLIKKPKKIFTISTASSLNNTTNSNALCLYDSSNFRIYNNEDDKFEERLDFGSLQCATKVFEKAIESFSKAMLCQDSWNILGFLLAISLLFWGIVLEVRGCPALTVMFFFSFIYIQFGNLFFQTSSNAEQFMNKSMEKVKSVTESLKELVQQCTVICCVLSVCMLTLWLDGSISDVLLIYTLFISIFLIIPGNLLQNSSDNLSCKDWDNEIEEFLPVVTEDNMKVLKRAGETGDNSSTPTTPDHDNTLGTFDDDFTGLKMPSHEEGSTDGMEFSELELNIGDTDTDGIGLKRNLRKNKTKNKKLEHSSSSEDELNLKITKVDDKLSDDTDEEFEFIHVQELSNIKNF